MSELALTMIVDPELALTTILHPCAIIVLMRAKIVCEGLTPHSYNFSCVLNLMVGITTKGSNLHISNLLGGALGEGGGIQEWIPCFIVI